MFTPRDDGANCVAGPGSNNESRYHTADQAIEACDKIETIYKDHPNYCKISNAGTFEQKISTVLGRSKPRLATDNLLATQSISDPPMR